MRDYFQTLFEFTKEVFIKGGNLKHKYRDVWREVFQSEEVKAIAIKMEKQENSIFRHDKYVCSIGREKWEYMLSNSWSKKGNFPTLYKVKNIYDPREIVICFLFCAGLQVMKMDKFLKRISINDQNYNTRPLYLLHYKEGFFYMVLAWNEKHEKKMDFTEAVQYYECYEKDVVQALWEKADRISKEIMESEYKDALADFNQAVYFQSLYQPLIDEMKNWEFPYTFEQEDAVQRLIVLCAHAERAIKECSNNNERGYLERNRNTRSRNERGTRLCLSVINRCANEERFADSVRVFQQQALPAMGEAYWRAVSKIFDSYAKSGGSSYARSPLVTERVYSNQNKMGKKYRRISIWEAKENYVDRILSFAVSASEIQEIIRSSSANTVLLADLFYPGKRGDGRLFGNQLDTPKHSILSAFLGNYKKWCEGKTRNVVQSERRSPTPYYGFKRSTVIKFALACGCTTIADMKTYLEFTGNETLCQEEPGEFLVYQALTLCERKRFLPILMICDMQFLWMYFVAERELKLWKRDFSDEQLKKCVKSAVKFFIYNTSIDFFCKQNKTLKKQEMLQSYYELLMILCMLFAHVSIHFKSDIAETVIKQFLVSQKDDGCGFENYLESIDNFADRYIKELKGIYISKADSCIQDKAFELKKTEKLLEMAEKRIHIIDMIENENSFEIKRFYDKWFIVLAGVSNNYDLNEKGRAYYRMILHSLKNACIRWIFFGGCRNFSMTFYKKKYKLDHFRKKCIQRDYKMESQWSTRKWELKENIGIWEDISTDARTIRKCYRYLKQKEDERLKPYQMLIESYCKELQKTRKYCQSTLEDIEKHGGMSENCLKNEVKYCKNQLYLER